MKKNFIYSKNFFLMHNQWKSEYIQIAKWINENIKANSFLDIGCGNGFIIEYLWKYAKKYVMGIDNAKALKHIRAIQIHKKVIFKDITKKIYTQKFEAVICAEVAEHIDQKYSTILVENLVRPKPKTIFFTAAPPTQNGKNHINLQLPHFWYKLLFLKGYILDLNKTILFKKTFATKIKKIWWYKENILIFKKSKTNSEKMRCFLKDLAYLDRIIKQRYEKYEKDNKKEFKQNTFQIRLLQKQLHDLLKKLKLEEKTKNNLLKNIEKLKFSSDNNQSVGDNRKNKKHIQKRFLFYFKYFAAKIRLMQQMVFRKTSNTIEHKIMPHKKYDFELKFWSDVWNKKIIDEIKENTKIDIKNFAENHEYQNRRKKIAKDYLSGIFWMANKPDNYFQNKVVVDIGPGCCCGLEVSDAKVKISIEPNAQNYRNKNLLLEDLGDVTYLVTEAEKIPLLDKSVDIVISSNSFDHVNNLYDAVAEIFRILKPRGELFLNVEADHMATECEPHSINENKVIQLFHKFRIEMIRRDVNEDGREWIRAVLIKNE